ncbi:MAG: paraquat-inducible protein A, partial [Deltaproteobacteria bacterium]|nr:paraquat-inducible protein A [Deltaproteobacteria bacterium]
MATHHKTLIACPECDLLLQEIPLPPGGVACCQCCGATLYRNLPDSINRSLALTVAAAILFIIANTFPVLGINLQGNGNA